MNGIDPDPGPDLEWLLGQKDWQRSALSESFPS